jgi:hypothetical protein
MKINGKQAVILLLAALVLFISELFPPWQYEYQYVPEWRHICPAGYGFITRPPGVRPYDEMLAACGTSEVPLSEVTTHRDLWRSNYQRVILFVLTIGLLLTLSMQRSALKTAGGIALVGLGILGCIGYVLLVPFLYM